jgi:HD-like signal output (HDOD) protein
MSYWVLCMNNIIIPESFPNLPSAVQKIQNMFAMGDINSDMLVKLLQEEPLLCANILKLVNSAHYGLSNNVTSIKHALMLLGTTVIRGIIMATVLKKSFPLDLSPYKISIEQFDKICILRARLLNGWLKEKNFDLQSLSSVAFLIESGKIITANEILKLNLSGRFSELVAERDILEAETFLFSLNNYELAAMLFKKWHFNEEFTNLILGVLDPKTEEEKILNVLLSAINTQGILSDENLEKSIKLLDIYQLDTAKFSENVNILKKELV